MSAKINVIVIKSGALVNRKNGMRILASEQNPICIYARLDGAWERDGVAYSIRRRLNA